MNNILSLLRPKDYVSKIKLYCRDCKPDDMKLVVEEKKPHVKRIKIEEICNK